MSGQPEIPMRMTTWDGALKTDAYGRAAGIITGMEMAPELVRYLDYSLRRQTADDRLEELESVDPFAAWVYRERQRGLSVRQIARHDCTMDDDTLVSYSERTIYYALARARAWVKPVRDAMRAQTRTPHERLDLLRRGDARERRAWQVYVLRAYGWGIEAVAEMLDTSTDTVKRDSKRARQFVGEDTLRLPRLAREALEVAA